MGPQKAIWCPAGLNLIVDLGLDLPRSNLVDVRKTNCTGRDDDRTCEGTPNQESSISLPIPLELSPRPTQESSSHGCELRAVDEKFVECRGKPSDKKALDSEVDESFLSLASKPELQESSRLPQHEMADLSMDRLDNHLDVKSECCENGKVLQFHRKAFTSRMFRNDYPAAEAPELQESPTLDRDQVWIHTSKRECDLHHDKSFDEVTNDCQSGSQFGEKDAECVCQHSVSSELVTGDASAGAWEEPYAFPDGQFCSCGDFEASEIPDSSSRETSAMDIDLDARGAAQVFRIQNTESSDCEQEWDPDAATGIQHCRAPSSDENMDTDCSESPQSAFQADARCPGIEQFNLAEISAACQLVGISNRFDRRVHSRSPESDCCTSSLRGVPDLEWMSRTLLELLSPVRDLDMDAYTAVQGTRRPRKAEEYRCSSESATMTESTTLNLPAGTGSIDGHHQRAASGLGSFDVDWEGGTVDDEVLDRPPWKREYRSLRELLN